MECDHVPDLVDPPDSGLNSLQDTTRFSDDPRDAVTLVTRGTCLEHGLESSCKTVLIHACPNDAIGKL